MPRWVGRSAFQARPFYCELAAAGRDFTREAVQDFARAFTGGAIGKIVWEDAVAFRRLRLAGRPKAAVPTCVFYR